MTGFFLFVIMGATDSRAPPGSPIAIGLCLTPDPPSAFR